MSISPLVSGYLTALRAEGKSPKTVECHRHRLGQFAHWMDPNGHPAEPDACSPTLGRAYLAHLADRRKVDCRPLSRSAVNFMARSLRAFCSWLLAEELVPTHPFARVKPPESTEARQGRPHARPGRGGPARGPKHRPGGPPRRGRAAVHAGHRGAGGGGMRPLGARDRLRAAHCQGLRKKGERAMRPVLGRDGAGDAAVRDQVARRHERPDLRVGDRGPLTTSGLRKLCVRAGRRAGVPLHPYKLRRTFAISFLRNGTPAFADQMMLGHASVDVTRRYAAMLTDDLVNEHRVHSPVARIVTDRRQTG